MMDVYMHLLSNHPASHHFPQGRKKEIKKETKT
jgi:hypothetical protein